MHPKQQKYSWWTYRHSARKGDLGWRIDHHLVDETLKPSIKNAEILNEAFHGDHCSAMLELSL